MNIHISEPIAKTNFVCTYEKCAQVNSQEMINYTVRYDKISPKQGKSQARVIIETVCTQCGTKHNYMTYGNASSTASLSGSDYIPF